MVIKMEKENEKILQAISTRNNINMEQVKRLLSDNVYLKETYKNDVILVEKTAFTLEEMKKENEKRLNDYKFLMSLYDSDELFAYFKSAKSIEKYLNLYIDYIYENVPVKHMVVINIPHVEMPSIAKLAKRSRK